MTLPRAIEGREYSKFDVDDDGNTVVRTTAKGEFTYSGLSVAGRVTEVNINGSSWTALPSTPLTGRNTLSIQNRTGKNVKLNFNSVESGYIGYLLNDQSDMQFDIKGTIPIYAKCDAADSPLTLIVMELA